MNLVTRSYGELSGPEKLLWKLYRHTTSGGDLACLRRLLSLGSEIDQPQVERLLGELLDSSDLLESVNAPVARQQSALPPQLAGRARLHQQCNLGGTGRGRAVLLYVLARLARPSVVVETGCFTGWDSALLLQALDRNQHGHLYSVDLPAREGQFGLAGPGASLSPDVSIGYLVPDALKHRWTLVVGDIRDELLPVLKEAQEVDLFYHDSDHSYDHVRWELDTALPYLRPGAVVVADDISWSLAFRDFAKTLDRRLVIHQKTPNVGSLVR